MESFEAEAVVIGAGAVGLAVARQLALSGLDTMILEKNDHIGMETSARNSEVIHAGIYYPTASLKARLCVKGRRLLYDFFALHGVPHKPIGNLIVAHAGQEARLAAIANAAADNAVDELRPLTAKDIAALEEWVNGRVAAAEAARNAAQGRVPMRRLNRAEYENTVRDLLGVELDLKDLLPPDTSANGFDNAAEALHVSSFLMEQYLEAADRVLDAAIVNGPKPWMIKKRFDIRDEKSVKPTGSVYRHLDDSVAIFSSWVSANIQVTLWQFFSHFRGNYRFKISAFAFQTDKPVTFHMTAGTMKAVTEERIVCYYDVPPGKPTVIEFVEKLEPRNTVRFCGAAMRCRVRRIPPGPASVGMSHSRRASPI